MKKAFIENWCRNFRRFRSKKMRTRKSKIKKKVPGAESHISSVIIGSKKVMLKQTKKEKFKLY